MESEWDVLADSSCSTHRAHRQQSIPIDEEEKLEAFSRSPNWPVILSITKLDPVRSADLAHPDTRLGCLLLLRFAHPSEVGARAPCAAWEGQELVRTETGSRLRRQLPASAVTVPGHGRCLTPCRTPPRSGSSAVRRVCRQTSLGPTLGAPRARVRKGKDGACAPFPDSLCT